MKVCVTTALSMKRPTDSSNTLSHLRSGVTSVPTTAATPGELLFSWADYLVFAISLAIPLAIGIFFYFYKRNEHSTEDFLVGNRSMNFVAVALSILASLLNGVFVIGTPAEIHYYGTEISLTVVGLLIAVVISAHTFIPKYQTMKFTSAYEVQIYYQSIQRSIDRVSVDRCNRFSETID
jgi:magnesium-transporting ATPase (P-type)